MPLWFLQSLFKGLVITYMVCLIPKKWQQWTVVVAMYLIGWICYEKDIHLFYSMNRDMGIVIAIFLGYELRNINIHLCLWQFCFLTGVLLLAAFWVKIDLVGGNVGQFGMFPLLTILGVLFVRNIILFCQQNIHFVYSFFCWLGKNSLYILIFHFWGFHVLSLMMIQCGIGKLSSLTNLTVLDGINYNYWFFPYTLVGLLLPFVYLRTKQTVLKYCNGRK